MPNCNRCQQEIQWPVPYVAGEKPLNMDNSVHTCAAPAPTPTAAAPTQGQPAPQAVTKVTPSQVMGELAVFWEVYGKEDLKITDVQFDALARIYISRMMSR